VKQPPTIIQQGTYQLGSLRQWFHFRISLSNINYRRDYQTLEKDLKVEGWKPNQTKPNQTNTKASGKKKLFKKEKIALSLMSSQR
jgi:hypothetical protein